MAAEDLATQLTYSRTGRRIARPAITKLMATALASPDLLSLAAGFTDTATLPVDLMREVTGELLEQPQSGEFLQYGTNQGRPRLRELLAQRLARQDSMATGEYSADRMLISNGSQQALALAVETLCDPGDIVLVEKPTYFVFLDVLRAFGVEARSIPAGTDGRIDGTGLAGMLAEMGTAGELERVKAVYLVSYFANPSSETRLEAEKNAVAEAFRPVGIKPLILEDGAYRDLHFGAPPSERSVLAMAAFDPEWPRLYLGTLTKPFATGLKVGFGYCTDGELLDRMLRLKGVQDFGTANFNQAVLERILETGRFDSYLGFLRKHYAQKMQVLHETLREEGLVDLGWQWREPDGGLYLWLSGPEKIDTSIDSPFCQRCLSNGVIYVPGGLCFGDELPPAHQVRLSFGVLPPDSLREAGKRFTASAREFA